jgi:hypothetical protein
MVQAAFNCHIFDNMKDFIVLIVSEVKMQCAIGLDLIRI